MWGEQGAGRAWGWQDGWRLPSEGPGVRLALSCPRGLSTLCRPLPIGGPPGGEGTLGARASSRAHQACAVVLPRPAAPSPLGHLGPVKRAAGGPEGGGINREAQPLKKGHMDPMAPQASGSLSVGNTWLGWNPVPLGHSPSSLGQTHGLGTRSPRTSVLEVPDLTQTLPGFSKWHEAGITACPTPWPAVPCSARHFPYQAGPVAWSALSTLPP